MKHLVSFVSKAASLSLSLSDTRISIYIFISTRVQELTALGQPHHGVIDLCQELRHWPACMK